MTNGISLLLTNSFCLSTGAVQGQGEAFAFQLYFLKQGCMCLMIALIVFKSEKQINIIETHGCTKEHSHSITLLLANLLNEF